MAPNMMSHPIFKKKGPTKKGFLRKLVVSDGGLAISTKLEEHGAVFTAKAVVTPVITFNDQSKATGSRTTVPLPGSERPEHLARSQSWSGGCLHCGRPGAEVQPRRS